MKQQYLHYFNDYLLEIKITKANGTYEFYQNHLMHIGRYFYEHQVKQLSEVTKELMIDYLANMKVTAGASTINKRVGIIKRCFIYYGIDTHYVHSIPKFKEKKRTFNMLSDAEVRSIIEYIDALDSSGNNLMYKGVIFLLINTGVRLTELYNIERKNVDISTYEILLTKTKNGYDRIVYFMPDIQELLSELLALKHDHKFLLHNNTKNRAINYSDIKYLFDKIKRELNIKVLHPHMFRHTYATNMLRQGIDIKTVMDLMGHNNLSTTQRYQHTDKTHAKKSYLDKYKY